MEQIFEVKFSLNGEPGLKTFDAYVFGLDNDRRLIFSLNDPEEGIKPKLIGAGMPEYKTIVDAKRAFEQAKLEAKNYSLLDLKQAFQDGEVLGADFGKINYEDFDSWLNNTFNKKKK